MDVWPICNEPESGIKVKNEYRLMKYFNAARLIQCIYRGSIQRKKRIERKGYEW